MKKFSLMLNECQAGYIIVIEVLLMKVWDEHEEKVGVARQPSSVQLRPCTHSGISLHTHSGIIV